MNNKSILHTDENDNIISFLFQSIGKRNENICKIINILYKYKKCRNNCNGSLHSLSAAMSQKIRILEFKREKLI